jgi:hypothetical protein
MFVTRGRVLGFSGAASAAVVALALTAYACTNLASLNLSTPAGKAGDTIAVTGSSFGTICVCGPQLPPTKVKIRWNGLQGEVLAEVMPDRAGTVSATFAVPDVAPGYYVIVATQYDETYHVDHAGTPARATFEVLTATGESVVAPGEVGPLTSSADNPPSSTLIAMTIALGLLSLALFTGGSLAVVRQVATRRAGVPARVQQG